MLQILQLVIWTFLLAKPWMALWIMLTNLVNSYRWTPSRPQIYPRSVERTAQGHREKWPSTLSTVRAHEKPILLKNVMMWTGLVFQSECFYHCLIVNLSVKQLTIWCDIWFGSSSLFRPRPYAGCESLHQLWGLAGPSLYRQERTLLDGNSPTRDWWKQVGASLFFC